MAAVDQLAQVVLEILLDQKPVSVEDTAELVVVGDVVFWGGAVHAQVVHVSVVQLDGPLVQFFLGGALVVVNDGLVAVSLEFGLDFWQSQSSFFCIFLELVVTADSDLILIVKFIYPA